MRTTTLTLLAPLAIALTGCLSPGPAPMDTESGSSGGETETSTTSASATMTTTSTTMTTTSPSTTEPTTGGGECGDGTVDADEECDDGAGNADDAACTSECKDNVCGDGHLLAGAEECDDGADNADNAACTSACKVATCGDELVHEGVEVCDDGVNDGAYGGCMPNCAQLGPYCGDGFLYADEEECDEMDIHSGCLSTCKMASSCLDIIGDTDTAPTGIYTIQPAAEAVPALEVWCEMDADGGGYTMIKVGALESKAPPAEAICATYGMKLFAPRTADHLLAAFNFATGENLTPHGLDAVTASVEFLWILGVYPVMPGISCVDKPFNSADCPEWQANDGGAFWITDQVFMGQPKVNACGDCSAIYDWNGDGTVADFAVAGSGGSSQRFLCDLGDK